MTWTKGFISILILFISISCSKNNSDQNPKVDDPLHLQEDLNNGMSIQEALNIYSLSNFYGLEYNGGYIFYINASNASGLLAAKEDLPGVDGQTTMPWLEEIIEPFMAVDTSLWSGLRNSILNTENTAFGISAAHACMNFESEGYDDWFLPSKEALNKMYINLVSKGFGGFVNLAGYWSSSVDKETGYIWQQNFTSGYQFPVLGSFTKNVRPIRAFNNKRIAVQEALHNGESPAGLIQNYTPSDFYTSYYQGGYIFHINANNGTGFIASELATYLSYPYQENSYTLCNTNASSIGSGATNTDLIINTLSGQFTAAHQCDYASYNGFSDWFLPSKDELNAMYENLYLEGMTVFGMSSSFIYWSSTEVDSDKAWVHDFSSGEQYSIDKHIEVKLRCVRTF